MSTRAGAAGQLARKPDWSGSGQPGQDAASARRNDAAESREQIVGREKEQFGGVKIGAAFFGWLATAGTTVLLSAIATAVVLALTAAIAGSQRNINAQLNTYPQLSGDNTAAAIISAIIAALVALGGAILGGLAGMRFHRRVDKAGLGS